MTAEEALDLYKSRDASEKLLPRGDKSYLGNHSYGTQTAEATHAKIFIEFVALIIRNRIYAQPARPGREIKEEAKLHDGPCRHP